MPLCLYIITGLLSDMSGPELRATMGRQAAWRRQRAMTWWWGWWVGVGGIVYIQSLHPLGPGGVRCHSVHPNAPRPCPARCVHQAGHTCPARFLCKMPNHRRYISTRRFNDISLTDDRSPTKDDPVTRPDPAAGPDRGGWGGGWGWGWVVRGKVWPVFANPVVYISGRGMADNEVCLC